MSKQKAETKIESSSNGYFMKYQADWIKDKSQIKIWDKSRRIGATYVQAYEDVLDCISKNVPAVWFSSADDSAAREYIMYCNNWVKVFKVVGAEYGEEVTADDKASKMYSITFANGTRINALSSNPKAFRSKGGKVVLDEFAFHNDANAIWKAAKPVTTWGGSLRILSTHNGKNCLYYKFLESVKKGKLKWSVHHTDILTAVDDGLVDRIFNRPTTTEERNTWLNDIRENCFDELTWKQEYLCQPVDEATAFLSYDLITACEKSDALWKEIPERTTGELYLGFDVARKKDLSVITIVEKLADLYVTRLINVIENTKFSKQRDMLYSYLQHPNLVRACIDQTGIGMQLAEEASDYWGKYKVEGVTFTNAAKANLAYTLKMKFEDKRIIIPEDSKLRDDLHSIQKFTTAANNERFDAPRTEEVAGHADRFWAIALAIHAGNNQSNEAFAISGLKPRLLKELKSYY